MVWGWSAASKPVTKSGKATHCEMRGATSSCLSRQQVEGLGKYVGKAEGAADGQLLLHDQVDRQFNRAALDAQLHDGATDLAVRVRGLQGSRSAGGFHDDIEALARRLRHSRWIVGAHGLIGPQRRRQVERTLANIADDKVSRSVVPSDQANELANGTGTRHQRALASDAPRLADAVDRDG